MSKDGFPAEHYDSDAHRIARNCDGRGTLPNQPPCPFSEVDSIAYEAMGWWRAYTGPLRMVPPFGDTLQDQPHWVVEAIECVDLEIHKIRVEDGHRREAEARRAAARNKLRGRR